jgi:2-(1,2-epoxy-1,2-dihydrophenyl)acetyl-CoA isomerase
VATDAVAETCDVVTHDDGPVRVLTLNRPARHNALVPELVEAVRHEVARVAADKGVRAIVLAGAGRSFSTGGDVAAFAARTGEALEGYARRLVGGLHDLVLDLLRLEVPVVAAVHGPVTGGSLGLVLASDLVVVSPGAWFAPYHVEVGYSPDGGWTALLPHRVGSARARAWQLLNERVDAETAVSTGLATHLALDARSKAIQLAARVAALPPGAVARTRALLRPDLEQLRSALDAERDSFVEQICTDEAARGMAQFLGAEQGSAS